MHFKLQIIILITEAKFKTIQGEYVFHKSEPQSTNILKT